MIVSIIVLMVFIIIMYKLSQNKNLSVVDLLGTIRYFDTVYFDFNQQPILKLSFILKSIHSFVHLFIRPFVRISQRPLKYRGISVYF